MTKPNGNATQSVSFPIGLYVALNTLDEVQITTTRAGALAIAVWAGCVAWRLRQVLLQPKGQSRIACVDVHNRAMVWCAWCRLVYDVRGRGRVRVCVWRPQVSNTKVRLKKAGRDNANPKKQGGCDYMVMHMYYIIVL